MPNTNNGGPAFPRPASTDEHVYPCNISPSQEGMSLRDYFAGQALAGECATYTDDPPENHAETIARRCYLLADAMLAYRNGDHDA